MAINGSSARDPPPGFEGDMVWKCEQPGCGETIEFLIGEADAICYMIVYHLAQKHGFSRAEVVAYDSLLRWAAEDYHGFPPDAP